MFKALKYFNYVMYDGKKGVNERTNLRSWWVRETQTTYKNEWLEVKKGGKWLAREEEQSEAELQEKPWLGDV